MIGSLVTAFVNNIESNDAVPGEITEAVSVAVNDRASFVPAGQVSGGLLEAGVDASTTDRIVADYEAAQLDALKIGLLIAALVALGTPTLTRDLPGEPLVEEDEAEQEPIAG